MFDGSTQRSRMANSSLIMNAMLVVITVLNYTAIVGCQVTFSRKWDLPGKRSDEIAFIQNEATDENKPNEPIDDFINVSFFLNILHQLTVLETGWSYGLHSFEHSKVAD